MSQTLAAASCFTLIAAVTPAAAMTINATYDASVGSTMRTEFAAVANEFAAAFTNPITVNLYVSVGTINGSTVPLPSGNVAGNVESTTTIGSFANVVADLSNTGAVLPATDPTGGNHTWIMPTAEAKALALSGINYPTYDAYIGFSSTLSFFNENTGVVPGAYDFQAGAAHEISEALGRVSALNGVAYGFLAEPLDLFRYTAPHVTSYTVNTATGAVQAYASVDGGVTDLGTYGDQTNAEDRSDWVTPNNTTSTDAQNAVITPGEVEGLSLSDESLFHALGYTISANNGAGLFSTANQPVGAAPLSAPEPAGMSVLATAAGGLIWARRRSPGRNRSLGPNRPRRIVHD